jgi:hypothetical protein
MGHTVGQRIRLSGTCPRNNEQRPSTVNVAPMFDSATLLVIEPIQITSDHVPPHQAAAPMFAFAAWPESRILAQNMNAGASKRSIGICWNQTAEMKVEYQQPFEPLALKVARLAKTGATVSP